MEINKKYLDHDFFTDVITFDFSKHNQVSGDIFISVDRVAENSHSLTVEFNQECLRVMVHGILHLIGFRDSSDNEKAFMRSKEDLHLESVKGALIFSK